MSVLIHPLSCSPKTVAEIQLATGLRALQERNYCRLVLPTGKNPEMRTTKPARHTEFDNSPFGGDAA